MLRAELARQQFNDLPIPRPHVSSQDLVDLRSAYAKLDKLDLFYVRVRNTHRLYHNCLIFTSPVSLGQQAVGVSPQDDLTRNNPFLGLVQHPEFAILVIRFLESSLKDLMSLAMTCRLACSIVAGHVVSLDYSHVIGLDCPYKLTIFC